MYCQITDHNFHRMNSYFPAPFLAQYSTDSTPQYAAGYCSNGYGLLSSRFSDSSGGYQLQGCAGYAGMTGQNLTTGSFSPPPRSNGGLIPGSSSHSDGGILTLSSRVGPGSSDSRALPSSCGGSPHGEKSSPVPSLSVSPRRYGPVPQRAHSQNQPWGSPGLGDASHPIPTHVQSHDTGQLTLNGHREGQPLGRTEELDLRTSSVGHSPQLHCSPLHMHDGQARLQHSSPPQTMNGLPPDHAAQVDNSPFYPWMGIVGKYEVDLLHNLVKIGVSSMP